MKVKELMRLLSEMDKDREVFIQHVEWEEAEDGSQAQHLVTQRLVGIQHSVFNMDVTLLTNDAFHYKSADE